MLGVAPADQERDQAIGHRVEGHAPSQHRSGRPGPLPVCRLARVITVAAGTGDGCVNVGAANRPAGQAAAACPAGPEGTRHGRLGLIGIGRDDLQVRLGAKREQRVVGAEPDVLASRLRLTTGPLLYLGYRCGQVGNDIDQVVNQHLIPNPVQAANGSAPGTVHRRPIMSLPGFGSRDHLTRPGTPNLELTKQPAGWRARFTQGTRFRIAEVPGPLWRRCAKEYLPWPTFIHTIKPGRRVSQWPRQLLARKARDAGWASHHCRLSSAEL